MLGKIVALAPKQQPRPKSNHRYHTEHHDGRMVGERLKNFLGKLLADWAGGLLFGKFFHHFFIKPAEMKEQKTDGRRPKHEFDGLDVPHPFAFEIFADGMTRSRHQLLRGVPKALLVVENPLSRLAENLFRRDAFGFCFLPALGAKFSFKFGSAIFANGHGSDCFSPETYTFS